MLLLQRIELLNIVCKLFTTILCKRLLAYTFKVIVNYQSDFQKKNMTDRIYSVIQILEKTREYNIDTLPPFQCFKTVCDSVNREKLLEAMLEFNISKRKKKLISPTRMTLKSFI